MDRQRMSGCGRLLGTVSVGYELCGMDAQHVDSMWTNVRMHPCQRTHATRGGGAGGVWVWSAGTLACNGEDVANAAQLTWRMQHS
eukprot:11480-Chlamydomonas_euryale.AAC.5